MANTVTTTTFSTTYKDDFRDSDQYHRILFNSGRALQARELTQMQTIIQEEMARFGRNIFVEGAPVAPGGILIENPEFIKTSSVTIPFNSTLSDIIGVELTVTGGTQTNSAAIKVRVQEVIAAENGDPITLYVNYTDTTAATAGATSVRVLNGDVLTSGAWSVTVDTAGRATKASVGTGEYFAAGHFVHVNPQTIFVEKYDDKPTVDLGFKIVEQTISVDDDANLYDNQGASPNIAAPGADRYKISLVLTKLPTTEDTNNNYVYVGTLFKGELRDVQTKTDGYNAIYDLMALRTKEESGNYVVNNYTAKLLDIENNDSNFFLELSRGTAYVDGYRLDTPPQLMTIPKARETITENNQAIVAQYGNYVIANNTAGSSDGLPNIDVLQKVNLRSAVDYGGSTLGTARVRAIEEGFNNTIHFYLFDIQMGTNNFRDVKSFGNAADDFVNIKLEGGIAVLKNTSNNSLLFDLPGGRPTFSGISDESLTILKRFTFTYSGTAVQLTAGGVSPNQDTFEGVTEWVLALTTGAVDTGAVVYTLASDATTVDVTPTLGNGSYELIAKVALNSNNISVRTKTLEAAQDSTVAWPTYAESDGNGLTWINMGYADIYELQKVTETDSNGNDLINNFTFDNGQRDNFYARGRLIAKPGVTIPTGDIFFKYRRFSDGASGNLFNVTSYSGQLEYEDIPSHTKSNGETVSLRDVLDFRPIEGTTGEYNTGGGVINPLPPNTSTIRADVEYFLPRKDKISVGIQTTETNVRYGDLFRTQGFSERDPQLPKPTTGHLELFNIELKPYTLGRNDIKIEYIENRRYTMKDIGKLEDRVDKLTELTTLSLLENNTATIEVFDSTGNPRTKAGFLADNFSNYAFSDIDNASYRATLDAGKKEITPAIVEKNVRLIYDSAASINASSDVVLKGDNLMLPYTETSYIDFVFPTNELQLNQFNVITNTGRLKLSPSSDEYFEQQWKPDIVIDNGDVTQISGNRTVSRRGDSKYQWYGNNEYVITGTKTVKEQVDEKVIEKIDIPFMRSIKIYFEASGLRPNTQHFAFFNGISVASWVRSETKFERYAGDVTDYGNRNNSLTGHPDGATTLTSNAEGVIYGSFVIPSTAALRFHSGSVIFKLIDITDGTDDNEVSSGGVANFSSRGIIEVNQRTFESTRHVDLAKYTIKKPRRIRDDNDGDGPGSGDGKHGGRTERSDFGGWGDPGGC